MAKRRLVEREARECARRMFLELTGGTPRPENWYVWYLCERHGGAPLIDPCMIAGQVAYWDGEDIVVDGSVLLETILAALPEELAHRLSSHESPRFEPLNYLLRTAHAVTRSEFQEMVGQCMAELFNRRISGPSGFVYPPEFRETA